MTPEDIHQFWFADSLSGPAKAGLRMAFWFQSSRETDELIARRFAALLAGASRGRLKAWEQAPRSCLALIITLDQFPRNSHRGTAAAFRHDEEALALTRQGIAADFLLALHTLERVFFLMPYQHAEDLASQREGTSLFEQLVEEAPTQWRELAAGILKYARLHLNIIERFGRFPHRNRILGRASTPAEQEYLKSNSESFGQSA